MHTRPPTFDLKLYVALSCLVALNSACQTRPTVTLDLPVATKYVFRGAVLNDRPVVQPELCASFEEDEQSLTLAAFGNLEASNEHDRLGEFTEVDYSFDYGRSFGPLAVSFGVARYEYPRTEFAGSSETHLIASYNDALITPCIEVWYDFDELDGSYLNFNISRSCTLAEGWSLDVLAGVGFMSGNQASSYFGVDDSGFSDALAQLTLVHGLSASTTLTLTAAFTSVLDGDFRDGADEPDNAFGAVGISFGF